MRFITRAALVLLLLSLAAAGTFLLARPHVERLARQRLVREAAAAGFSTTLSRVTLRPSLTLELRDLVLEDGSGVRLRSRELRAWPRLSWLGLTGRAVNVAHERVLVDLPAGLRLQLAPARWAVERRGRERRLRLLGQPGRLEIALERAPGASRASVAARQARLSGLVEVSRHGCPLVDPGTATGTAQVETDGAGAVRLQAQAQVAGLAVASLEAAPGPGCSDAPFGAPTDVGFEADLALDPRAGTLRGERLRVRAAGVEAGGRLRVEGGATRPQIVLDVEVPRVTFGPLLSAAGLDPAASDLGSASLSLKVAGPLLEPAALRVEQRLDFRPPSRPVPQIERLRAPFVHTTTNAAGQTFRIHVSPESPDFIGLDEVPELFLRTLLISEDANFWGHPGIDLAELPAALATNLERGSFARGGSTIPQQLAKNLFLSREKRIGRKLEEASLALLLDSALGKRRELEVYLNIAEWGPGLYGLRPAARHYFAREPSELTPRQMAFLVSMLPGPVKYQRSITDGIPSAFLEGRMAVLLSKLADVGALSFEEYVVALSAPLDLVAG